MAKGKKHPVRASNKAPTLNRQHDLDQIRRNKMPKTTKSDDEKDYKSPLAAYPDTALLNDIAELLSEDEDGTPCVSRAGLIDAAWDALLAARSEADQEDYDKKKCGAYLVSRVDRLNKNGFHVPVPKDPRKDKPKPDWDNLQAYFADAIKMKGKVELLAKMPEKKEEDRDLVRADFRTPGQPPLK